MKKKYPYIVHINPNIRPRDPVDLWKPLIDHMETGTLLALAMVDAVGVFMNSLWIKKKFD